MDNLLSTGFSWSKAHIKTSFKISDALVADSLGLKKSTFLLFCTVLIVVQQSVKASMELNGSLSHEL
jgi:hypothetical protein